MGIRREKWSGGFFLIERDLIGMGRGSPSLALYRERLFFMVSFETLKDAFLSTDG